MQIIPAILEKEWGEINKKINLANKFTSWIQIDITDNKFVPHKSWNNSNDLIRINSRFVEIDMMINEPEKFISDWINTGVKRLIIHIESTQNLENIIRLCRDNGVEIGIALNIGTSNKVLDKWIGRINFIQFMGIVKIGFQGQQFNNAVLNKIKNFRKKYPNVIISIDGGVNFNNANLLKKMGANRLVVGSYIWNSKNPKKTFNKLKNL